MSILKFLPLKKINFLILVFSLLGSLLEANLQENPLLDARIISQISPYFLPLDHPMKPKLDAIFSRSRALQNEQTLIDAGFIHLAGPRPYSYIIVVRHPEIPGYVFKLYLDCDPRSRKNVPHWKWLTMRCAGAKQIRKIIKQKNIRHFIVPDKWLYVLPVYPYSSVMNPEIVILMETDVQPESRDVTERMWKTGITREHLDELYTIVKHGYGGQGTLALASNVPYTKSGKFAFTDTEDPQTDPKLKNAKHYLSKEMGLYWDSLIGE